MANQDEMG